MRLAEVEDQREAKLRTREEGGCLHCPALPGVEGEAVAVLAAGGDGEDPSDSDYNFSVLCSNLKLTLRDNLCP